MKVKHQTSMLFALGAGIAGLTFMPMTASAEDSGSKTGVYESDEGDANTTRQGTKVRTEKRTQTSADGTSADVTTKVEEPVAAPVADDEAQMIDRDNDGIPDVRDPDVQVAPVTPAQPATTTTTTNVYNTTNVEEDEDDDDEDNKFGASLGLGGGVTDFTDDTAGMSQVTDTGGEWTLRLGLGTRSIVGFEAAYVGASNSLDALGVEDNAQLMRNGLEGALRIQAPIEPNEESLVAPYIFGGLGWHHYDIVNSDTATSDFTDSDDALATPVGAGLALGYDHFLFDARFTYRPMFNDDILQSNAADISETTSSDLINWTAGAMVGYEF